MLKKALATAAAMSLLTSPVLAQSRPLPQTGASVVAPEPAAESAEGSELLRGGYILPLLGLAAVILAILALTNTWPFDDKPTSP
jgi:hypothetical protein